MGTSIALMAYIKATADMNVIIVVYRSAASPFVITFAVLGLYARIIAFKPQRDRLKLQRQSLVRDLQHITLA